MNHWAYSCLVNETELDKSIGTYGRKYGLRFDAVAGLSSYINSTKFIFGYNFESLVFVKQCTNVDS